MKMFSHSAITVLVIAVAMVLVMTSETDESDEDEREYFMSDCFKTYSHCMGTGQNGCIDRCNRKGFVVGQCFDSLECPSSASFECICHGHYFKSGKKLDN